MAAVTEEMIAHQWLVIELSDLYRDFNNVPPKGIYNILLCTYVFETCQYVYNIIIILCYECEYIFSCTCMCYYLLCSIA